jgi:uncharacterized protein YdeI (YjbR/CyaY-like superfamily)
MPESKLSLLRVNSRSEWRIWLENNFRTEKEVWLVNPKMSSGKDRIPYSQANIERLRWLLNENLIHPSLEGLVKDLASLDYVFPQDILDQIKQNLLAWKNYQAFPGGYRRIRIAYIDSARKRPEEFARRLAHFIAKTIENKLLPGHGGIEKYYWMS